MKSFQEKTSDLLKQQKATYPKMVKAALKGKTGLTRAQVNKTIKGVAKDYREQYGATPRKRYIKALTKVSAEGLEPIAAKSVKTKSVKAKAVKTKSIKTKPTEAATTPKPTKPVVKPKATPEKEKPIIGKGLETQREADRQAQIKVKADHKAKYATTNKTFIKSLAADLGLPTATIEALYKVAADYRKESKLRPVMCGLYCDPDGYLVATDAHILVATKCNIPAKHKGKIYLKSGMTEDGKFPNWKFVCQTNSVEGYTVSTGTYHKQDTFNINNFKEAGINIEGPYADAYGVHLSIPLLKKLDKVAKTLKQEFDIFVARKDSSVYIQNKQTTMLIMPTLFNK